jgi:hypothetical protein
MLRLKIMASAIPPAIAALLARGEFPATSLSCIEIAGTSVQMAALPWQAQRHVRFTGDIGSAEARSCQAGAVPQPVAVSARHRIEAASL